MTWIALFTLIAAAQTQNIVKLNDSTEIEFVSPGCVRVARGKLTAGRAPITADGITKRTEESNFQTKFQTPELDIAWDQRTGLFTISTNSGLPVFQESAAKLEPLAYSLEIRPTERFYGFGPRPQAGIDARGLIFEPPAPFFISSRGYAFWLPRAAKVSFDVGKTAASTLAISGAKADTFEYFFAFGPSMKEMWEERGRAVGQLEVPSKAELEIVQSAKLPVAATPIPPSSLTGKELLCAETRALFHSSLSGILMPAFDLGRYRSADDDTFRRAARLGAFTPFLYDSSAEPLVGPRAEVLEQTRALRRRLWHFLVTYADETRYRGYPVIHPFLMQFPRDPEAGLHMDAYMFGDEFLVAPVCDGGGKRDLYLPMGNWSNWNTGESYQGRRTASIEVPADGLIVLVKNGAIVPLAGLGANEPTELHYFPKNGGEAFLFEPDAVDYTQAHAGPALSIYRVEVESKVSRRYEWVVHNFDRPKQVGEPGTPPYAEASGAVKPKTWRYDAARRELHIGVDAPAKSDVIVNIGF